MPARIFPNNRRPFDEVCVSHLEISQICRMAVPSRRLGVELTCNPSIRAIRAIFTKIIPRWIGYIFSSGISHDGQNFNPIQESRVFEPIKLRNFHELGGQITQVCLLFLQYLSYGEWHPHTADERWVCSPIYQFARFPRYRPNGSPNWSGMSSHLEYPWWVEYQPQSGEEDLLTHQFARTQGACVADARACVADARACVADARACVADARACVADARAYSKTPSLENSTVEKTKNCGCSTGCTTKRCGCMKVDKGCQGCKCQNCQNPLNKWKQAFFLKKSKALSHFFHFLNFSKNPSCQQSQSKFGSEKSVKASLKPWSDGEGSGSTQGQLHQFRLPSDNWSLRRGIGKKGCPRTWSVFRKKQIKPISRFFPLVRKIPTNRINW